MKKQRVRLIIVVLSVVALVFTAMPGAVLAASQTADLPQTPRQYVAYCSYTVNYGDTLYSIAVRSRTNVYALAAVNGLYNVNLIYSGMNLRVPCGGSNPAPAPAPVPTTVGCPYYIVRPGDYLKRIAALYGTTWQAIAAVNRLYNPNLIYSGMRLEIPCGSPAPSPSQWKTYTSYKHGYLVSYPGDWTISVQTPGYAGDPENVSIRPVATTLPAVQILALKGAPPITGYENCTKNMTIQGVPACSITLPGGQVAPTRVVVFQKGNDYYQLSMQYSNRSQLAIFQGVLESFRFTQWQQ